MTLRSARAREQKKWLVGDGDGGGGGDARRGAGAAADLEGGEGERGSAGEFAGRVAAGWRTAERGEGQVGEEGRRRRAEPRGGASGLLPDQIHPEMAWTEAWPLLRQEWFPRFGQRQTGRVLSDVRRWGSHRLSGQRALSCCLHNL